MKQLFTAILAYLLLTHAALAALAIDGSATATTVGVALTTTQPNDVIVAFANCAATTGTCSVTGVSDTGAHSWTRRATRTQGLLTMEEWYTTASSPLSAVTITAAYSGQTSQRIVTFGISGANTGTPFDTDVSLPSSSSGTTATTLTQTISTGNANTMLLAVVRSTATLGTVTEPTGFTQIISAGTNQDVASKVVTSAQSSLAETYSWTGATTASIMIADAIQIAGAVPAGGMLLDTAF